MDIPDVRFWGLVVSAGRDAPYEINNEAGLMELCHLTNIALVTKSMTPKPVYVKIRGPDEETDYTIGALVPGKTYSFSTDLLIEPDTVFSHTGTDEMEVHLTGYRTINVEPYVVDDDEEDSDEEDEDSENSEDRDFIANSDDEISIEDDGEDDDEEQDEEGEELEDSDNDEIDNSRAKRSKAKMASKKTFAKRMLEEEAAEGSDDDLDDESADMEAEDDDEGEEDDSEDASPEQQIRQAQNFARKVNAEKRRQVPDLDDDADDMDAKTTAGKAQLSALGGDDDDADDLLAGSSSDDDAQAEDEEDSEDGGSSSEEGNVAMAAANGQNNGQAKGRNGAKQQDNGKRAAPMSLTPQPAKKPKVTDAPKSAPAKTAASQKQAKDAPASADQHPEKANAATREYANAVRAYLQTTGNELKMSVLGVKVQRPKDAQKIGGLMKLYPHWFHRSGQKGSETLKLTKEARS